MIIYNVTINIEEAAHKEWLTYMRDAHIPDVMNTGCFKDFSFSRLITKQEGESGTSYSIQYKSESLEKYNEYNEKHAPSFQQEHKKKFAGKFVAFRSLMESVE